MGEKPALAGRQHRPRRILPPYLLKSLFTVGLALGAACGDLREPLEPAITDPVDRGGSTAISLQAVTCQGSLPSMTLTCGPPPQSEIGLASLIVGGQGLYVELTGSNVAYNAGTQQFTFDVTVQNLIPQPLATTDQVTPAADGVRVFFHTGPTATAGSGTIDVIADGLANFTGNDQPFYQYSGGLLGGDGILSTDETSGAKTWTLTVPNTVVTFAFTVFVWADVPFPNGWVEVSPPEDLLFAGGNRALDAVVYTPVGNEVPGAVVTWDSSDEVIATVDGAGNVSTLTPGNVTITASSSTHLGAVSGTAAIGVCPNLALGEVYVAGMPAGSSICLGGGGTGMEYVVTTVNVISVGSTALTFLGTGIGPVVGAPTPDVLRGATLPAGRTSFAAQGYTRDYAFEAKHRQRERQELTPLLGTLPSEAVIRAQRMAAPRGLTPLAITPGVPNLGDQMSLNVESGCNGTLSLRTGEVVVIGDHIIIIEDLANPANGLTAADYQEFADRFDELVHPTLTTAWGTPTDLDSNSRVIAFFTSAVNAMTPPGNPFSFVGGFVASRDLTPTSTCSLSNVGELFYMLAADPDGDVNGNVRTVELIKEISVATLAHEFAHLISFSRSMHVNGAPFEEVWLEEGLAHMAEELVFYAAANLQPGGNISLVDLVPDPPQSEFFEFAVPNFALLAQWLLSPHSSGLFQTDDDAETRGQAWAFLRYAADRKGGDQNQFWFDLVNSSTTGLTNLEDRLGTNPLPWIRDFNVAMYADDAGISEAAPYTMPSWNFRSIFPLFDFGVGPVYPLQPRNPANDTPDVFTLANGGSAAFSRLGVAVDQFGKILITAGGGAPPGTIMVGVIRRK